MDIDKMIPHDLSIAVAEKVMGWTDIRQHSLNNTIGTAPSGPHRNNQRIPDYALYIWLAWMVVEKLTTDEERKHPLFFKCNYRWGYEKDGYPIAYAAFDWKLTGDSHPLYVATAALMPAAICKAALKAVTDDVSPGAIRYGRDNYIAELQAAQKAILLLAITHAKI
jgi:hypothetical protein